ncbi:ABSCISIC ACID-INSENSITIVE 5-like protein [Drosera capensis]
MNLGDFLKSMPTAGVNRSVGVEVGNGTNMPAFKHQAGVIRAQGLNKRTVEEVWREIQLQENMKMKMKSSQVVVKTEREPTVCEMTLEDFLAKAGALSEPSFSPAKLMNAGSSLTPQSSSQKLCLSPAISLGVLSDKPLSKGKRHAPYAVEKTFERKMRRKIKNRESAARSRARKQAYTNELIVKVSHLEAVNMKLKREKNQRSLPRNWRKCSSPIFPKKRGASLEEPLQPASEALDAVSLLTILCIPALVDISSQIVNIVKSSLDLYMEVAKFRVVDF